MGRRSVSTHAAKCNRSRPVPCSRLTLAPTQADAGRDACETPQGALSSSDSIGALGFLRSLVMPDDKAGSAAYARSDCMFGQNYSEFYHMLPIHSSFNATTRRPPALFVFSISTVRILFGRANKIIARDSNCGSFVCRKCTAQISPARRHSLPLSHIANVSGNPTYTHCRDIDSRRTLKRPMEKTKHKPVQRARATKERAICCYCC